MMKRKTSFLSILLALGVLLSVVIPYSTHVELTEHGEIRDGQVHSVKKPENQLLSSLKHSQP
ncbi:hypothetical protein GCM10008967_13740 [Bacillus carboniphilus]|uniref:Uncharacterized protein n=1 Tax=Bacillus carboniphilus TaxID=86663 RepID=A0ABP3FS36_9BACI